MVGRNEKLLGALKNLLGTIGVHSMVRYACIVAGGKRTILLVVMVFVLVARFIFVICFPMQNIIT